MFLQCGKCLYPQLNFKKGDIITVTQPLEDGWYEGTLRGVTGWFPANYVAEYKTNAGAESTIETQAAAEHRALLITNIIETEAAFVRDLDSFTNCTDLHASDRANDQYR